MVSSPKMHKLVFLLQILHVGVLGAFANLQQAQPTVQKSEDGSIRQGVFAKSSNLCAKIGIRNCPPNQTKSSCNSSHDLPSSPGLDFIKFPVDNVSSTNISSLEISRTCSLLLCDNANLLGDCLQFVEGWKSDFNVSEFDGIPMSTVKSFLCVCNNTRTNAILKTDEHFDRNFVGVVYAPFDKYWYEGNVKPILPNQHSLQDIEDSLRKVSTKFTTISTSTLGSVVTKRTWSHVASIAAKINAEAGLLVTRLSLEISRGNMNIIVNSSIDANTLFPGTIWGLTVVFGPGEVKDMAKRLEDVVALIIDVRKLLDEQKVELQVGVSIKYVTNPVNSSLQVLFSLAREADYILCYHNIGAKHTLTIDKFADLISAKQNEFMELAQLLKENVPSSKLIIVTGVPSEGIGNGFNNSVENLRDYWWGMAKFAKDNQIKIHFHEAMDQPWKSLQDEFTDDVLKATYGPNGSASHEGWWKRESNSEPGLYIEKIAALTAENLEPQGTDVITTGGSVAKVFRGVTVFFLFVIVGLTVYFWGRTRDTKKKNVIKSVYVEQFHDGGVSLDKCCDKYYAVALRMPYDKKHELAEDNFRIERSFLIGSGQSGRVFRGKISNITTPVAFKCTIESSSVLDLKNLLSEIKILSYIGNHENVVCLLGAFTKQIKRGVVYLALEYCPLGNLEKFLKALDPKTLFLKENEDESKHYAPVGNYVRTDFDMETYDALNIQPRIRENVVEHQSRDIRLETFVLWAYQIASAMEFVSAKQVIHADLAARNVLLVAENHVKVSDFGLSKKLYAAEINKGVTHHDKGTPLPWRWMAPESLRELAFSVESDVWSFGVTIWEIFSLARQSPYQGIQDDELVEKMERGLKPLRGPYMPDIISEEVGRCWNINPTQRPSFSKLKEFFGNLSATSFHLVQETNLTRSSEAKSMTKL